MNVFPYAALLTSALLATPAFANPCRWPADSITEAHGESVDHQDIGNGVVLSRQAVFDAADRTASARHVMEFCQSGRSVGIIYSASCYGEDNPFCDKVGLDGEGSFKADRAPIEAAIIDMNMSSQMYSWQEFTQRLEGLGARFEKPVVSESESCACAVFYPELQGNRRPHKVRNSE